jgi:hypothetical protein
MRILLVLVLYLLILNCKAQSINYEQIAFEYFFKNIYNQEYYSSQRKVSFKGHSEKEISMNFPIVGICLKLDSMSFRKALNMSKLRENKSYKDIDLSKVKHINFRKKSDIVLKLYSENEVCGLHYVEILIILKKYEVYYFIFEISDEGNIIRWCKTGYIR